eukprot:412638-Rhodomonas_salina.1
MPLRDVTTDALRATFEQLAEPVVPCLVCADAKILQGCPLPPNPHAQPPPSTTPSTNSGVTLSPVHPDSFMCSVKASKGTTNPYLSPLWSFARLDCKSCPVHAVALQKQFCRHICLPCEV